MAPSRFLLPLTLALALLAMASADFYGDNQASPTFKGKPLWAKGAPLYISRYGTANIQGLIYCKKDGKLTPLEGAMARVTCMAMSSLGYETAPFSVVSGATGKDGYFRMNLGPYGPGNIKLQGCRAFLETSGPGICNVPTDENHGITGAPLGKLRVLSDYSKLYSVGPFVYTTPTN
ncbi:hypothetical protein Ancab_021843 [Ancistrocladus abbreviatus]